MEKIFVTSDTHFCHDREFIFKPRGFEKIADMNEAIVERWNNVVTQEDTVYHLGDAMLNDNDAGIEFLKKLNGKIYMLNGNHDTATRIKLYAECPNVISCGEYAKVIKYRGYSFYLSHYPTLTSNLDNDAPLKRHVLNIFGHTHQVTNFYDDIPFMYHAGLDSHNCYPVDLEQVIEDIKNKVNECKEQL